MYDVDPAANYILPFRIPTGIVPGVYTFDIVASDGAGNTAKGEISFKVTATLERFNIYLMPNWNLISLPLMPSEPGKNSFNIATEIITTDELKEAIEAIWYYDASAKEWKVYTPDPEAPDTLLEMSTGKGYWVVTKEEAFEYWEPPVPGVPPIPVPKKLTIIGTVLRPGEVPPTYELAAGWNLIGFHSEYPGTVENALASIMEPQIWGALYAYDNYVKFEPEEDPPFEAVLGKFTFLGTTDTMEPGKGYWLWMKEEGILVPAS
jgi:hypothetical protein